MFNIIIIDIIRICSPEGYIYVFVITVLYLNWILVADDEVVKREEEMIKLDGLNVAQIKEMRDKAEKFTFQAEVNRMMKLIINSLYKNKEVSCSIQYLFIIYNYN